MKTSEYTIWGICLRVIILMWPIYLIQSAWYEGSLIKLIAAIIVLLLILWWTVSYSIKFHKQGKMHEAQRVAAYEKAQEEQALKAKLMEEQREAALAKAREEPAGKVSFGGSNRPTRSNTKSYATFQRLNVDNDISTILKTTDYVVLDTETTGLDAIRDKIVQIAIVSVVNGEVVDTFTSFVDPGCSMPYEASQINHITDDDLVGAPTPAELVGIVRELINDKTIIAHNAKFDLDFLSKWFKRPEDIVRATYIDTLALSRKAYPNRGKYSLQRLVEDFGIDGGDAHRADSDALATQQLFEICKAKIPYLEKEARYEEDLSVRHTLIEPTVTEFDENHPLYKKSIVFSGYMEMPRAEAMQNAANCGALLRNSVSRRTNYLVLGETIPPNSGYSNKVIKAEELNQTGEGHIKIITEQEFYELIRR